MTESTPLPLTALPLRPKAAARTPSVTSSSSSSTSSTSTSATSLSATPGPQLLTEAALQQLGEENPEVGYVARSDSVVATEGSVATVRAVGFIHESFLARVQPDGEFLDMERRCSRDWRNENWNENPWAEGDYEDEDDGGRDDGNADATAGKEEGEEKPVDN